MVLIFIKIFIILCLSISIFSDFSADATCLTDAADNDNCGGDSGSVYPDILAGGNYNTAYGYHAAGMNITDGDDNTALGYEAGRNITTGSYNTAIGSESLNSTNTTSSNTALGYRAGYQSTGTGNIFIGANAGYSETNSNRLYISNTADNTPLIFGNFSSNELTINDDLSVTDDLTVADNITASTINSGNITSTGNISTTGNLSASNSNSTLKIGNTILNSTELGYIDSVTPGTIKANTNSAVIVDENSDINGFRNVTATGTISANTIQANTITDSNGDRFLYKDTSNDIVHIGSNSMLFYDSSTYGKDIMASSTGKIQIGKNITDSTTIVGDLIVQEPTEANHAATRKYADQVSLMASTLDTRLPLYGNKHSLNLSSSSTNREVAFGLNFVGIYDGLHLPIDFSLGSAFSEDYNMGKLSVGMSW